MPYDNFRDTLFYRYGLAVIAAVVAVLVTALLWEFLHDGPFILLVGAVVVSAWQGGFLPGILCAAISIIMIDFFVIEPRFILFAVQRDIIQFVVYGLTAGLISWMEQRRRHSETALRKLRDELEVILDSVNDGITVQDAKGNVVFANAASASITGQPTKAMLDTPINQLQERYELLNEDETSLSYSEMPRHQVFITGKSAELTFGLKAQDRAEVRWITLNSSPIFDAQGKVRLAVNVMRDVTEKRGIEKQRHDLTTRLELQQRHMEDILNNIPGIVYESSGGEDVAEQPLMFISRYAEPMLGYPLSDLESAPNFWHKVVHPEDWSVALQLINKSYNGSEPQSVPFRCITADRRTIYTESYNGVITGLDGRPTGTCGIILDVTERRHQEAEIQRLNALIDYERRRLATIISNVPGIVFESSGSPVNGPQRMDFISDYIQKMLGYSPNDGVKDPNFWPKIVIREDWEAAQQQAVEIYSKAQSGKLQFRCIASDGRIVHMEAYFSVIGEGESLGTVGVMMDVTERRLIEKGLNDYANELRQSNEDLERFAYVASHDLQEPLRMVTSYLQLVEQRYTQQLDNDAREFIAFAVDGASRMKTLIDDLLAYSGIQRNQSEFERVSLQAVLDHVLYNLQLTIEDTDAIITYDTLPELNANRAQMTQLLQNLIGNALKFRGERAPKIRIEAKREQSNWHITVSDNGIGIEVEYLERIFVIFQRLHARNEYPGTGIGLAICKKVVEKHGGHIYARSLPGEGTTFHIIIPVS
jgi:PAS domain S-box-containing protein